MKRLKNAGQVAQQHELQHDDRRRSVVQSTGRLHRAWQRVTWETGPADATSGLDWFALDRWEGEGGRVD